MDKRLVISRLGITLIGLLAVVTLTSIALAGPPCDDPGGPVGVRCADRPAGAQSTPEQVDVSNIAKTETAISNVANGLATVLFALSVIFIIISGIFYLTAAGNQTQLDKAKNTLIYAIVGVVLGLIAFGVAGLVKDFLVVPH